MPAQPNSTGNYSALFGSNPSIAHLDLRAPFEVLPITTMKLPLRRQWLSEGTELCTTYQDARVTRRRRGSEAGRELLHAECTSRPLSGVIF